MSLTSCLSLFFACVYPSRAFLTFSAMSTSPHLLISSYRCVSGQPASHLYVFLVCVLTVSGLLPLLCQQCLSCHIFWSAHQLTFISCYSCPCNPSLAFVIFSVWSTTPHFLICSFYNHVFGHPSSSFLLAVCPYRLWFASLNFPTMCIIPHILISLFHNVSDHLFFVSGYYVSVTSQLCFPYLLCNVYQCIPSRRTTSL